MVDNETPSVPMSPAPEASPPVSTPPPPPPWWTYGPPKKRSAAGRVFRYFFVLLLVASILVNVELAVLCFAGAGHGMSESVLQDGAADQVVAVFGITGMIDGESVGDFWRFYEQVRDDKNIKAVVIRVNSPGGGVSASDQIYQKVKSIRDELKKPVVVSMGGVAASGGYYVSAPAETIYAEPTTITGSIGVIMAWPVMKGFLDKHGVEVVTIRSPQAQRWKAAENYWELPDTETKQHMRELLQEMHAKFEQIVVAGRGKRLKTEKVKVDVQDTNGATTTIEQTAPLNDRVYLAEKAKALGLIDEIGYLVDAATAAADGAGLTKPKIVQFARTQTLRERLGFSDAMPAINLRGVEELLTPRVMLLWKGD